MVLILVGATAGGARAMKANRKICEYCRAYYFHYTKDGDIHKRFWRCGNMPMRKQRDIPTWCYMITEQAVCQ